MNLEQRQASVAFLQSRGIMKCPVCSSESLSVDGFAGASTLDASKGPVEDRPIPFVQVVCATCAHTMLFSARVMGI